MDSIRQFSCRILHSHPKNHFLHAPLAPLHPKCTKTQKPFSGTYPDFDIKTDTSEIIQKGDFLRSLMVTPSPQMVTPQSHIVTPQTHLVTPLPYQNQPSTISPYSYSNYYNVQSTTESVPQVRIPFA